MPDILFSVFPDVNFVDLTLYQYGYEKCHPLHSYGPHVRNHYLFHYVISGEGTLFCENQPGKSTEYQIHAGQGFLIEPEIVNTYRANRSNPWEYTWIEFDGLRAKGFMNLAGLSSKTPVYTPSSPQGGLALQEELLYIANHSRSSALELIAHLYLVMDHMIHYSSSRKKTQGGKISEFYTKEAISYIEQNYSRNLTVEELASICGLDRSYFGKVFKETMGQSPQEFLIHYRMSRAAELLAGTDLSVGEIGVNVGYPNQLHFSRAFKTVHGISPRQYRQNYKIMSI